MNGICYSFSHALHVFKCFRTVDEHHRYSCLQTCKQTSLMLNGNQTATETLPKLLHTGLMSWHGILTTKSSNKLHAQQQTILHLSTRNGRPLPTK